MSFALLAPAARAQEVQAMPSGDALFAAIGAMDTKLFDAYNRCDLDTLGNLVSDDLEFYHDQTGLSTGRKIFIESIKNNICGKVHRDLVASSLEVYPLHGYGAVEIGEHVFCDSRKMSKCDPATAGAAKFTMLWRYQAGTWQLTRVISYNHVSDWQRKAK
jgi:hypothetical protein